MGVEASQGIDKMSSDASAMFNNVGSELSLIFSGKAALPNNEDNIAALEQLKIFTGVSDIELNSISNQIRVLRFKPGATLVANGEDGNSYYVVKLGQCTFHGPNVKERVVEVGECIDGETSSIITAITAVELWMISKLLVRRLYAKEKRAFKSTQPADASYTDATSVIRQSSLPHSMTSVPVAMNTSSSLSQQTSGSHRWLKFSSYLKPANRESPGIRENNLKQLIVLGKGAYGKVTLVKHKKTKAVYALKTMYKHDLVKKTRQSRAVSEKNNLLACRDQPFIVNLHSTFKDSCSVYMLMEYLPGGILSSLIDKGPVASYSAQFYSAGIVLALEYLASRKMAHRDLKPENVLIDAQGYPKLTDFGFSKVIEGQSFTFCGTPKYLAPEMIQEKGHDCGVDYWALGVLLYEMRTGHTPFEPSMEFDQSGETAREELLEIACKIMDPKTLYFPAGYGSVCKDITKKLLKVLPEKRLGNLKGGVEDIKKHAWFAALDLSAYRNKQEPAPWVPSLQSADDSSHFKTKPVEKEELLEADDTDCWDRDF